MKQIRNIIIVVVVLLFAASHNASAQKVSISTNTLTWVNFGTANLEASVSVSKHFTIFAGAKYNPWEIRTKSQVTLMNQQTAGYLGAKYWPWHVYSGWWIGAKAQYQDFTEAGLWTQNLLKGQAAGLGLSAGYSIMITPHINLDLGLGGWGGRVLKYTGYKDLGGIEVDQSGSRNFIFLDNIIVAFAYIF